MRAVNLLPRDAEREGADLGRAPIFVVAGGIAVATAGAIVLFLSASGSVSDQRSQLDSLHASVAQGAAAGQPAVLTGTIVQERADRVAALAAALTTRAPLEGLLRQVALVLPEDAWLTGFSAAAPAGDTPASAPAPAPSASEGVTIVGATYSNRSIARVLARLATLPSLEGVRLAASARVEPTLAPDGSPTQPVAQKKKKQKTVVTFTIAAQLRTGTS